MSPNAPATQHHIESESHPIRPHLASFPHSTGRQAQRNSDHQLCVSPNAPSPSPTTSDARQDAGKSPQLPASCKNRLPCHGTCRHLSMFRDPAPPKPEAAPQNRQQPPQSSFPQVAICRWFFPYSGYSLMFVRLALSTSVACMVSNTPVPYRKGCPTAHRRASPTCPLTLRSLVRLTETKQRRLLRTKQTRTRRN